MPDILMSDPFSGDAYSLVSLTRAINLIKYKYGRLLNSGIFTPRGIDTKTVGIEREHNKLKLITSKPRGIPGEQLSKDKRDMVNLNVPHFPVEDRIIPEEYANKRTFGTSNVLETANSVMLKHQLKARKTIELVWEWMMWGAIKGQILDGDGSLIYDLYSQFGFTENTINFELDDPDTDVREKCLAVHRHVEDNLHGDVHNGVMLPVASDFFDKLIRHPSVEKYFVNHVGAMQAAQSDPRSGFPFSGIDFVDVRDSATRADGTTVKMVADGYGHVIPLGTLDTFDFVFAPGDFMDAVNTEGQEIYYSLEPLAHNRGYDVHCETNPLAYCMRPNVLCKVVME